jgi:hypothetical protein
MRTLESAECQFDWKQEFFADAEAALNFKTDVWNGQPDNTILKLVLRKEQGIFQSFTP